MRFVYIPIAISDGRSDLLIGDSEPFDDGNGIWSDFLEEMFDGFVDMWLERLTIKIPTLIAWSGVFLERSKTVQETEILQVAFQNLTFDGTFRHFLHEHPEGEVSEVLLGNLHDVYGKQRICEVLLRSLICFDGFTYSGDLNC